MPPLGRGSMYMRPLLLGTGATLGLQPAPEVTFVIFSAAVGSYFKGGTLSAIQLKIETRYHRAAPLGVGAAKCAGDSQLTMHFPCCSQNAVPQLLKAVFSSSSCALSLYITKECPNKTCF